MMSKEMINYEVEILSTTSSVKDYMSLHAMPIYGSVLHEKWENYCRSHFQKAVSISKMKRNAN
jgi:hypothetical protein